MFEHIPVMLNEAIDNLKIKEDGIYVDCTVGGAGHSIEIVKRLKSGRLIAIDQDEKAINAAKDRLKDYDNVTFVKENFSNLNKILEDLGVEKVDGILMDIGVSSYQFDTGERGFSYKYDSRLDMRMDRDLNLTAYDIVNEYSSEELQNIFWKYGEEKWGKRIAEFIEAARKNKRVETTFELVEIIKKAIPKKARQDKGHPAKRVFQALRIEVNKELEVLEDTIYQSVDLLNSGGRLVIITFHSLEDRIVKNAYRDLATDCICPSDFPVCVCNHRRKVKMIKKHILPSQEEINRNKRAHSAKMRVAERVEK